MKTIKAVALDVDGVLTDGTFWWGTEGAELKRFSFRDVMGVSQAGKKGLVFALISGEDSPLIDRYAKKTGIGHVFKGCRDKRTALLQFAEAVQIPIEAVGFVGDDINDLEALQTAGFSACPCNAHPSVLAAVHYVSTFPGGAGAVRQIIDFLLE